MTIHLAFFQPDIPQNIGAAMRLCACLSVPMHIIEPTGFIWKESEFRRSGMDYISHVDLHKHVGWGSFCESTKDQRKILLTTKSSESYIDYEFQDGDILLMGRESAGAPDEVHAQVDGRITIPMAPDARSLNVVNSASLVLGEALRQTNSFPK